MRNRQWTLFASGLAVLVVAALIGYGSHRARQPPLGPDPLAPIVHTRTAADQIVNGAKDQARRGVGYDASYCVLSYPGGDVPADRGTCTDVIVRSLRAAGYDLQSLLHDDMVRHFALYPQRYGLAAPDASIDHRRVPNQMVYFRRFGQELPVDTAGLAARTWQPGDFVYWKIPGGGDHCGVYSDVRDAQGLPMVIHNASRTAQQDVLTRWPIQGHFRFPRQTLTPAGHRPKRTAPTDSRSRAGARSARAGAGREQTAPGRAAAA